MWTSLKAKKLRRDESFRATVALAYPQPKSTRRYARSVDASTDRASVILRMRLLSYEPQVMLMLIREGKRI